MMTLKTCNKCGEEKPFSAFRKDRSKADGHHGTCNLYMQFLAAKTCCCAVYLMKCLSTLKLEAQ